MIRMANGLRIQITRGSFVTSPTKLSFQSSQNPIMNMTVMYSSLPRTTNKTWINAVSRRPSSRALRQGGVISSPRNHNIFPLPIGVHLTAIQSYTNNYPRGSGGGGGNRLRTGLGVFGTGALVLWGKGKYLLGALKLTKFASLGSMLVTVGTYSIFFGWPYAVGMVGLILVHECGHALVMHQRGIPFSPMVFMPFLGATVAMKRRPADAWEDALVAFGGPVLGSAGAAAVAVGAHSTDSQLLFALADFGFMINLFNLMPLGMMDGGRICGALSPYAGVVGLGIGGTMIYEGMISNPIFYLIMLGGGYETYQRFSGGHLVPPNYYRITPMQRVAITGGYFGLVGALFGAMAINEQYKKPPQQLQREREWGYEERW
mmetsp:Transcript_21172/g.29456  ORF Transcript_21172/g.29456 Transcript_21172/m.29456 type:complete len:374 (-) Transcript_21172:32-1153(-)